MIGLHPLEHTKSRTYFGNFLTRHGTAEARRNRALGLIPVNGVVSVAEGFPSRVVLAAQWGDPIFPDVEDPLPSLRDTAQRLYDVGNTSAKLTDQTVVALRGLDARAVLRGEEYDLPPFGFSVDIGTLQGDISYGHRRPSKRWHTEVGLPTEARALEFQVGIETHGVTTVDVNSLGDVEVSRNRDTAVPFYAGKVCLEPNKDLYRRSRDVAATEDIIFGDQYASDALLNLARRASEAGLADLVPHLTLPEIPAQ